MWRPSMGRPGELSDEAGRAYLYALTGSLQRTAAGFTSIFDVLKNPDKLSFHSLNGHDFSFDVLGTFKRPPHDCEVLLECKGYQNGSSLLTQYREFLAKAYSTSITDIRHRNDLFWFVTNVPFGTNNGRLLTS